MRGRRLPMMAYHHLRNALLTLGTIAELEPRTHWRYADNEVILWLACGCAEIAADDVINRHDAAERMAENCDLWAARDLSEPRTDDNHWVPPEQQRPRMTAYRSPCGVASIHFSGWATFPSGEHLHRVTGSTHQRIQGLRALPHASRGAPGPPRDQAPADEVPPHSPSPSVRRSVCFVARTTRVLLCAVTPLSPPGKRKIS